MTRTILVALGFGLLVGYFCVPEIYKEVFLQQSEWALVVGLSALLFFVGLDLGFEGKVIPSFKQMGFRILAIPLSIALGTLAGGLVGSLVLPISGREALAVSAGFGWYSLAPIILTKYSAELSAISFAHNVMRELFGIVLIPVVAKYVGYVETCSLAGSAAADVCLPIIEKSTNANMAAYSFVTGIILSGLVPLLVPLIAGV